MNLKILVQIMNLNSQMTGFVGYKMPVYIYNWAAGSIKDTCFASVTCADWKYRYGMVY